MINQPFHTLRASRNVAFYRNPRNCMDCLNMHYAKFKITLKRNTFPTSSARDSIECPIRITVLDNVFETIQNSYSLFDGIVK